MVKKLLFSEIFQNIIIPIISVLFIIKFNWEPLKVLNLFGSIGKDIYNYLVIHDCLFNLNISFWLIILTAIISFLFRCNPIIRVCIRNNRTMEMYNTSLPSPNNQTHLSRTYHADIYVNYNKNIWYKILNVLGGIQLVAIFPDWVDIEFNDIWEIGNCAIENRKMIIPIGQILSSSKLNNYTGEMFIGFTLLSRKSCHNKDKIEIEVNSLSSKKYLNKIASYVMKSFCEIEYKEHTLQTEE